MDIVKVDRAIHELRAGRFIDIDGQKFIHPEFIHSANWPEISAQNPHLIITAKRASALLGEEVGQSVSIDISNKTIEEITLLIAAHGKLEESETEVSNLEAGLQISRLAELLPTIIVAENQAAALQVTSEEVLNYKANVNASLTLATHTKLNLKNAPSGASVKAFRPANGDSEYLAIIIGKPAKEPIIRVHSSCYTGDLIGSLSCDCGDQLTECIKLMEEKGGGIILYLMQEGRGIGLINKLRAYNLQHGGMDTVEANEFLGFDDEEREFEPAALMLREMNISAVELVSNNPKKATGLEELGIKVKGLIPLHVGHEHNEKYLQVKAAKSGHLIEALQNS